MSAAKGNKYSQHGDKPMTSHLHCRITPEFKAKCVRQANKDGKKLCEWVMLTLSKAV